MKAFILEHGKDFICIDEEYRLQVGCSDFRIDLQPCKGVQPEQNSRIFAA